MLAGITGSPTLHLRVILEFIRPKGYIFLPPKHGSDPTKDSDVDPATDRQERLIYPLDRRIIPGMQD
jgi:hypothetical protein